MSDSSKKARKTLSALSHALHSSKKSSDETSKEVPQSTEFVKNEDIFASHFDTPSLTKRSKDHPHVDNRPSSEHSNHSYGSGEGRATSQGARSLPTESIHSSQALKVSVLSQEKEEDDVDGAFRTSDTWNDQIIDVSLTHSTLQYLDEKIVEMKELLAHTQKERQSNVANFLLHMDETGTTPKHPVHKNAKEQTKMRSAFEIGNKQSNKQEQEIQAKLEYLERCRRLVGVNGVPKGVTMKAHLKALRKVGDKKFSTKMVEEVVKCNQPAEKKIEKTIFSQRSRIKYPSNENLSQPRETSFAKPQIREKQEINRGLKNSAIHGGSVGTLDNHNQQAITLTPSRHLESSGAGDISKRSHTLKTPSQSSGGNPSAKNLSSNCYVPGVEQYNAIHSHFSTHTEGKTSRSSGGDRERERVRLDSSSMTGSIGTEQELSNHLQSGVQSKMLEELQSLRTDLQLLDESSRRLEAQLKELQRNTKTDSEYSAQHIDSIARKVDKLEARTDEFKLFTDSRLQAHATNFKNLEGRFEYWMGNALRNLHDSIEGVENQVKQLENRVGNLAQRPSSSWWNHSDSSLQNHFITSLLHLLAFLAIVVSYILQLFLKSINYATHMLQHRSGLSVMIMLLFILIVFYKWIPPFEDVIDTQVNYMWQWIQRYLHKS